MPLEVLDVTKKFMRDPIRILVKKEELTLEGKYMNCINLRHRPNDEPIRSPAAIPWHRQRVADLIGFALKRKAVILAGAIEFSIILSVPL